MSGELGYSKNPCLLVDGLILIFGVMFQSSENLSEQTEKGEEKGKGRK